MRHLARAALAAVLVCIATPSASAQPWVPLPGGAWGLAVHVTTTGFFSCLAWNAPGGSCSASGNAVTITNGGAAMTLSFTGTTQSLIAGPGQRVSLGTFQQSFTGPGPFAMPIGRTNIYEGIFSFTGTVATNLGTRMFSYQLTEWPLGSGRLGPLWGPAYLAIAVGPYPAGSRGPMHLVFDRISENAIVLNGAPTPLMTVVSITPEPATVALLAGGLLALGAVRTIRRRHQVGFE